MKRRCLLLLIFTSLSTVSFAQKENQKAAYGSLSVTASAEKVTYNFDSLKNLEENMDSILEEMIANSNETTPLTVALEINLIKTDTNITFTASTTAPTSTITATVKRLCLSLLKGVSE